MNSCESPKHCLFLQILKKMLLSIRETHVKLFILCLQSGKNLIKPLKKAA